MVTDHSGSHYIISNDDNCKYMIPTGILLSVERNPSRTTIFSKKSTVKPVEDDSDNYYYRYRQIKSLLYAVETYACRMSFRTPRLDPPAAADRPKTGGPNGRVVNEGRLGTGAGEGSERRRPTVYMRMHTSVRTRVCVCVCVRNMSYRWTCKNIVVKEKSIDDGGGGRRDDKPYYALLVKLSSRRCGT